MIVILQFDRVLVVNLLCASLTGINAVGIHHNGIEIDRFVKIKEYRNNTMNGRKLY